MSYIFQDKSLEYNELVSELLSSEYCHISNGLTYEEVLKVFKENNKPVNENKIRSLLAVWKQRKRCEFTKKEGRLAYFLNNKKSKLENKGSERTNGEIQTVYIEAGKPVTALRKISEILEKISGDVLICDNYFGLKSIINLYKLANAKSIKFICGNINGDKDAIVKLLKEYNQERKVLEVKLFDKAQLHDRYIITKDSLIILGHGFADLGNKESLIILIPINLVGDMHLDLTNRFNQKWNGSKPLV